MHRRVFVIMMLCVVLVHPSPTLASSNQKQPAKDVEGTVLWITLTAATMGTVACILRKRCRKWLFPSDKGARGAKTSKDRSSAGSTQEVDSKPAGPRGQPQEVTDFEDMKSRPTLFDRLVGEEKTATYITRYIEQHFGDEYALSNSEKAAIWAKVRMCAPYCATNVETFVIEDEEVTAMRKYFGDSGSELNPELAYKMELGRVDTGFAGRLNAADGTARVFSYNAQSQAQNTVKIVSEVDTDKFYSHLKVGRFLLAAVPTAVQGLDERIVARAREFTPKLAEFYEVKAALGLESLSLSPRGQEAP